MLLKARADADHRHEAGVNALMLCTTPGAVKLLLDYRADLESQQIGLKCTPLTVSTVYSGNTDTVKAMLRHGALLEPPPAGFGAAPVVFCALINDDKHIVGTLLAHRADPGSTAKPQGAFKYLGRMLAAFHGRRMLGASPFQRMLADLDGLTALGAAALSGRAGVVLELLKARASPDQNHWRGLSPRALAQREGFPDMFDEVMTYLAAQSSAQGSRRVEQCAMSAAMRRASLHLFRQLPAPLMVFAAQRGEKLPQCQERSAEPRNIQAQIRYAVPARVPHQRDLRQTPPVERGDYVQLTTTIWDARGLRLKLDEASFELLEGQQTALSTEDFYMDDARIQDLYYPEIKAMLAKKLGTPHVLVFNHIVRNPKKEGPMSGKVDGVRGVSLTVHTDLTSIEADTLFEELVPQLPKECRHGRYMLINVWRSIGDEPVEDDHLALLDERTTAKPDDYVQTEYWSTEPTCPQMVQYILSTRNAPAHRWYYVPRMTRSEVLVFKSFDSKPTCPARLCFHTAVKDPTAREGCPTRQSIDVRALVCFPAHEPDSCPPLKVSG